jgi:cyclopropane-fatty-acyl-phospholipid synthase
VEPWYLKLLHTGLVPDRLVRPVLFWITRRKIRGLERLSLEDQEVRRRSLLDKFRSSEIALAPDLPNLQHYEVPPAFFQRVLGKRMKYSCCLWTEETETLDQAEEAMLELTCRRAGLEDGMDVLDLGCGWGSLTFWIAEHFPNCRVLAVSNSRDQVEWIQERAARAGLDNVRARVRDVNRLGLDQVYDRVFSVEMFEHMKNYPRLLRLIADHLKPGGKLFVHLFSHRQFTYEYQARDRDNWMAQTFFTGGTMPADDLLLHFQEDVFLEDHWRLSGRHYAKTLRAWLNKMDRQRTAVREILAGAYGRSQVQRWWINWRLFFLACEATWAWQGGREYLVSHYLFRKRKAPAPVD